MAAYSEQDKAVAVEIVQRFGGEVTAEALAAIRQALAAPKLNKSTVWRWYQAAGAAVATGLQPAKNAAAQAASMALDDFFELTARKMLTRAIEDEVIGEMKGRELVTAAAIAVDKMRLLRDLPTEIVQVMPALVDLNEALQSRGIAIGDVFEQMMNELAHDHHGD